MTLSLGSLIACKKSGGGGGGGGETPQPAPPVVAPACGAATTPCPVPAGVLLAGVQGQTADGLVQFRIDLGAQSNPAASPYGNYGSNGLVSNDKAPVYYYGQVTISGLMRVVSPSPAFPCLQTPGDYVLRSLQPSMMGSLMVQGGVVEAVGPGGVQLLMQVLNSQLYNPQTVSQSSQGNRIGLNVWLGNAVTGQNCGQLSTY